MRALPGAIVVSVPACVRTLAALSAALAGLLGACGSEEHPPTFQPIASGGAGGSGGLSVDSGASDGPPSLDAQGLCGNQILPVLIDRPNLYFVVDRSGSMQELLPGSNQSKYVAARIAFADVLSKIGHRVHYGAAVFPSSGGPIVGCAAGAEVFPTQSGDPASYAAAGQQGPVLKSFLTTLASIVPEGGTPIASTVDALRPILTGLPGKTVAVLATDGAPNCNLGASCGVADCQLNVEGGSVGGKLCNASFNCCDPTLVPDGQLYCVDADPTEAAITALALAGVDTYVIGMPGSEYYSDLLDTFALAGNTPRPTLPHYYPTSNSEDLADALRDIGVKVAVSCTITLDQAPPDANLVNVYLDATLVTYDEVDGWAWIDATTLELRGAACAALQSGDVLQVQVVSGCPTQIR